MFTNEQDHVILDFNSRQVLLEMISSLEDFNVNKASKVDLNSLIAKVKEEEKKTKRQNIAISAAALSAIAVFGIIITL